MRTKLKPVSQCGAYLRVSTAEQAKKYSPEVQITQMAARIARAGGVLVKTYRKDLGKSGAYLDERTDLQEAIRDIQSGVIDTLCFYDVERFSRDLEHQQRIMKTIHNAGGNLLFCTMEYEPTADGELGVNVSGVLAQRQRKKTRELSISARMTAAHQGVQTQRAWSPYGYRIVNQNDIIRGTHSADELGRYIKNPDTNPTARRIFDLVDSGTSLRRIMLQLQAEGVPAPHGGRRWHHSTIYRIITNPCYMGRPAYGRRGNNYDPERHQRGLKPCLTVNNPESEWIYMECAATVDAALWQRCNEILKQNQRRRSGNPRQKTLLSGLLRCPTCGRHMIGLRNRGVVYYMCARHRKEHRADPCPLNYRGGRQLEAKVIQAVLDVALNPDLIDVAYREWREQQRQGIDAGRLRRLQNELSHLNARHRAAAEAKVEDRAKGISDTSVYDEIMAAAAARRGQIEQEITRLKYAAAAPGTAPSVELWAEVAPLLQSTALTDGEKNDLLARIIDHIETPSKRSVVVWFRPPEAGANVAPVWRDGVITVA